MLTAQVEPLTEALVAEVKPLLPIHYEELSLHQFHGYPLNPIFEVYLEKQSHGEFMYVTLRENGKLCGYFSGFVSRHLHYQDCLTLVGDIFYVVPEHRGNKGGVMLFSEVKREAVRRGVKAWFVGDKQHSKVHAEALFRAFGFEHTDSLFCLWLGDK